MPFVNSPRFPTINAAPSFGAVVANYSFFDCTYVLATTAFCAVSGFIAGKPLRRQGMTFMAPVGLVVGFFSAYRISEYKLLGYWPNARECASADIEFKELRKGRFFEP